MNIIKLTSERKLDFINYCMKYRNEFDITFLDDQDLISFEPNEENPTYILLDNNNVIGAVSLMINSYYRRAGSGRFRIFHTIESNKETYEKMLNLALKHIEGLQKVFMFIDGEDKKMAEVLKNLNFDIKRYSYTLINHDLEDMQASFPVGYELREFQAGRDEADWCKVRNLGFSKIEGCDTPKTPEMYNEMEKDYGHLPGGIIMLYHKNMPIGQVRASKEVEDDIEYVFISSLCVIPEHQGKGLGRNLLKVALNFGKRKGIQKGMLSVNAENENAVSLYLNEGFEKESVAICHEYYLNSK
ncbi:GNAT family N-acetyltransferase [Clostridium sp. D2Q-11]|uniref:GNAT family N-acetyltransferase n=1 Tax=Anaeromonas frigoriresistens TaxID=2683708 RepID=A0A942UX23_9FIRM|nr:GNAT family N-acetyltransferase [Anaeromonas frigoriresistens]MBS4538384.1 GNAT family N-acetyltransferase [Anaeromonas frigoriresistens]